MKKYPRISLFALGLGIAFLAATVGGPGFGQQKIEGPGERYGLDDVYDQVHQGVRLILAYNRPAFSFMGSVENVSDEAVEKVRVKIQLSNGTELGPSEAVNLVPGEKSGVKIDAFEQVFEWWRPQLEFRL